MLVGTSYLGDKPINKIYLGDKLIYSLNISGSRGAVLGDSSISSQDGSEETAYYLFTPEELSDGYSYNSLAVSGETIAQQKTRWLALSPTDKSNINWAIPQVGLNDLGSTPEFVINSYQDLIDTIISTGREDIKIIACTFIPSEIGGDFEGYANWLSFNAAIRGLGSTPITGCDIIVDKHTDILNDGTDQMKPIYWNNGTDASHPNNTARDINAKCWRDALIYLGIVEGEINDFPLPVLTSGTITGNSAIINWSSITNAQAYKLERSTDVNFETNITKVYLGNNLTYSDSGLSPNTTYYYRLQAIAVGYNRSEYGIKSIITENIVIGNLLTGMEFVLLSDTYPDWFSQDGSNVGKYNTIGNDRSDRVPYDLIADSSILLKVSTYRTAIWLTATNDSEAPEVCGFSCYEGPPDYSIAGNTPIVITGITVDSYIGLRKIGNNIDIIITNDYGASFQVIANVGINTAQYLWFYTTGGGHSDYMQNKI